MLKKGETLSLRETTNMRGGDGTVRLAEMLGAPDMANHGRLFARITLNPGCSIGYHVHTGESEVFYVESGKGAFDDNGTVYEIKAGDVTITPDGSGHAVKCVGDEPLQLIALILYA